MQELAWSSFALLKNTNSCGAILLSGEKALMGRGAIGANVVKAGDQEESLANITKVSQNASEFSRLHSAKVTVCSGCIIHDLIV